VDRPAAPPQADVPRVDTTLTFADRLGAWKARWAIGRMRYRVEPGLYAIGNPTAASPVLVSANYKMSFDSLRSRLTGLDAWILVLDTRGINVWCAAGKGTFGTDEIVRQVEAVGLAGRVEHRRLILPQLGAPGVRAHEVRRRCGFRVIYGPVRARDLPTFLAAGMKATPEMRRVRFPVGDRVALIPVELVTSLKYVLLIAVCFVALAGLGPGIYGSGPVVFWLERAATHGLVAGGLFVATWLAAVILFPALLPWLPGRAFSLKGTWIGLALFLGVGAIAWGRPSLFSSWPSLAAWAFLMPAVASFLAMNFTGASTYTSLSGVRREMRFAVPVQLAGALLGVGLWIVGLFV
jgi:acetyl-CoA decarbonylase/synthase complex subunit gamma